MQRVDQTEESIYGTLDAVSDLELDKSDINVKDRTNDCLSLSEQLDLSTSLLYLN